MYTAVFIWDLPALLRETGRLGRDGKQCICYFLHNGLLTSHCGYQVKELVDTKNCRKNLIRQFFPATSTSSMPTGCLCCDFCSQKCDCAEHSSISVITFEETNPSEKTFTSTRYVSKDNKALLRRKLLDYRESLIPTTTEHFLPVGSTGILFEFDHYQIDQVLTNCRHLFRMNDILSCAELWRNIHANMVNTVLNEVFNDMEENVPLLLSEEDFEDMEVVVEDWGEIRNDNGRAEL